HLSCAVRAPSHNDLELAQLDLLARDVPLGRPDIVCSSEIGPRQSRRLFQGLGEDWFEAYHPLCSAHFTGHPSTWNCPRCKLRGIRPPAKQVRQ
ncbi:unnamed protein product, partial [Ectocarpus sp. 12 AP-2014]